MLDPSLTTCDASLTSVPPFVEEKGRRCRPGRFPKYKLWLKPKLGAGIVELVGGLIGPVMVPVDIEVNQVPDGEECAR